MAKEYPATGGHDHERYMPFPEVDPHARLRQYMHAVAASRQEWRSHWQAAMPSKQYPVLKPVEDALLPDRARLEAVVRANERAQERCVEFVRSYCAVLRAVNARRMLAAALLQGHADGTGQCPLVPMASVAWKQGRQLSAVLGNDEDLDGAAVSSKVLDVYQSTVVDDDDEVREADAGAGPRP